MEFSVRIADQADTDSIVMIYVASWNAGFQSRMPAITATPTRLDRWRTDLSTATFTHWWVAELDGRSIGFVGIGPGRDAEPAGWGELDTIAVTPDYWGRGVGSALMNAALGGLRQMRFPAAYLWTLSDYPLGERFYEAKGWTKSGLTRADDNQVRYDIRL